MRGLIDRIPASVLILILLASVGVYVRVQSARHCVYPTVDGVYYMEQSRSLVLHHKLPFSSFPPGWPAFIAIPLSFADATDGMHVLRSAQGANILLGVLWCILAYCLLRREMPDWGALVGTVVLIGLPAAIIASKSDLSENSYSVALLAAFLLLPRHKLWTGVALGYAYLIRPEALLILVGLATAEFLRNRRIPWGLLAGAGPLIAIYVAFIHHSTGHLALTGKMGFLSHSLDKHPGMQHVQLVGRNIVSFLPMLTGMLGIPIVLISAVGFWRRSRRVYLALLGLALLPLFDFAMSGRYWLPYVPFVLIAAGHGVTTLALALKRFGRTKITATCCGLLLAGAVAASDDDLHWVRYSPDAYDGIRDAGLWLRDRTSESTRVAAYKPFASFWAGCAFVKYPEDLDINSLLDYLSDRDVEFLVVNGHVAKVFVPALQALLGRDVDPALKARVEPLKIFYLGEPDQTTVVFRLRK